MIDLLSGLNSQQKDAVVYCDGPLLIMAGAGSGKTKVLTHKIAYLKNEHKVSLSNILAVTFTNKAAKEMLERVENLVSQNLGGSFNNWILTFHSFGHKVLRMHSDCLGYEKNFVVYDSDDQKTLIKQIMGDFGFDPKMIKPSAISYAISKAKNDFIDPNKYIDRADVEFKDVVGKVYQEYQKRLKQNNAMDFDDLLINTVYLFRDHKTVLAEFQNRFEYILIDEYQDINMPQYYIARMLSSERRKLFVVGDTDQNIYSWRGANLQNILNFEKDFPEAKVIFLEQNYRSTKNILNIANGVISQNKIRKKKQLWTDNDMGEKADFYVAKNEYDEAEIIAKKIQDMIKKENIHPEEIAVLYRVNAMSRVIETMLMQNNISYRVYGGMRFYDRREIKDMLAYLRLIQNIKDDVSFARIINVPTRKIGKMTEERVYAKALSDGVSYLEAIDFLKEIRGYQPLAEFKELILSLRTMYVEEELTPSQLLERVYQKSGYKMMLEQEKTIESKSRMENIEELMVAAKETGYGLEEFLSTTALITSQDEKKDDQQECITLMTLHSAKGLEFDHIFLMGFEEKMLPHMQSMDVPEDLEEERRLCYVGFTRARKKLNISFASYRSSHYSHSSPQEISRFFYEIPAELLKIKLSSKLSSFDHVAEKLSTNPKYDIERPSLIDNKAPKRVFRAEYVEEPNKEYVFDYSSGDVVTSPVFGDGIVLKTYGKGKDISLQIKFAQETKLILPKYGKLTKI